MRLRSLAGGAAAVSLTGCRGIQSALDPQGSGAAAIYWLWQIFFYTCIAVFIVVVAALLWAMLRRAPATADTAPAPTAEDSPREMRLSRVLTVATAVTVAILLAFTLASYA